jgi:hypothetical protein
LALIVISVLKEYTNCHIWFFEYLKFKQLNTTVRMRMRVPDFTSKSKENDHLRLHNKSTLKLTRQAAIQFGIHYFHEIGSDSICKICIANGGSCCIGCSHLADGIGCQLRNTGCTAWLCGFLKYFLYETGHLQEWNSFWDQVPGQDFRRDFTPESFNIHRTISAPDIRSLGEALAADLEELAHDHIALGFIVTLKDKIDKCMDQLELAHDPYNQSRLKRKIAILSSPFHRFHKALREYRSQLAPPR